MLGLGWIPTCFVVITTAAYILPYVISTSLGHVYYIFPAISDSGVRQPEALVFRELINISGFLSICNIYIRYKQYKLILKALQDASLDWVESINYYCAVSGCIGGLGVTFVGNFKSRKAFPEAPVSEYSIHNVAAVVVFVTGLIYCSLQTYVSYHMTQYNVNTRLKCHWRAALTLSVICNFFVFTVGSVISTKQYGYTATPVDKLKWMPSNPGYQLHVISNVAEWIMCFSFIWFSLTFVKEFQKIRITSDFVAENEREAFMSAITLSENNIDTLSDKESEYIKESAGLSPKFDITEVNRNSDESRVKTTEMNRERDKNGIK